MQEELNKLKSHAEVIISNCTAPVNDIIDVVLSGTTVSGDGSAIKLSMDDLYAIAIRLPAECAFLQAQINSQLIEQKVRSFMVETQITESIVMLQGSKGDASERKRRAEAMSKDDVLADIVTQQIIAALQATVQRADKVYEGIKKVIDCKSREMNYDGKPGRPVG